MRLLILVLTAFVMALAPQSASAQNIPDVLGDIFGGSQNQTQTQAPAGLVYIENIPVNAAFDARPGMLPSEATLIITAVAPPKPNERRASPLIMGETRILISRLAPPLQMVIAVPSDLAREVPYAQISGRIVDSRGVTTHESRDTDQYDGNDPAFLNLEAVGGTALPSPAPTQPAAPIYDSGARTEVSGRVSLKDNIALRRGSNLVIRVYDAALAGGNGGDMLTEERISLDQRNMPFDFSIYTPLGADGRLDAPSAEIFIEDWAGRKTHVLPRNTEISIDADGRLSPLYVTLDSISSTTGAVYPNPPGKQQPVDMLRTITGKANFDAFRGLPSGSTLNVRLIDPIKSNTQLAQTQVQLDGLSGDVDYALSVDELALRGRNDLFLEADIVDRSGKALFVTRRLSTLSGVNADIRLETTPAY